MEKNYFLYIHTVPYCDGSGIKSLRNELFSSNDKETGPFLVQSRRPPRFFHKRTPNLIRKQCLCDLSLGKLKIGRRRLKKTDAHIVYKNEVSRSLFKLGLKKDWTGRTGNGGTEN